MPIVELRQGLIAEFRLDISGSCLVALVYQKLYKFGLVQVAPNDDILALLDVNAHPGDEAGIASKSCLFHSSFSLFILIH